MLVVSSLPAGLYPTYSWETIINRMRNSEKHWPLFTPMVELVEQIARSPYAAGLFPATSMANLILVQTPEWNWEHDRLQIEYDSLKQLFRFEWRSSPRRWGPRPRGTLLTPPAAPRKNWARFYPASEGFGAFIRFIRAQCWFVEYRYFDTPAPSKSFKNLSEIKFSG